MMKIMFRILDKSDFNTYIHHKALIPGRSFSRFHRRMNPDASGTRHPANNRTDWIREEGAEFNRSPSVREL